MAQPPQSTPDSKMARDAAAKVGGGEKATAAAIAGRVKGGAKATNKDGSSIVPRVK